MLLYPGFKLNNKYLIKKQLGSSGGSGAVFYAIEEMTGREVAVKEFFVEADPRELQLLAKLKQKNIIEYITYELYNNTLFLIMEYAPGGSLAEIMREKGKLPEKEALSIFTQLVEGLAFAHEKGIVHRDIKPLNILLGEKNEYKIADFGIARLLEKTQGDTQQVRLSLGYAAPELFKGQFSTKTDVYALGLTLYEMLTGFNPYSGTQEEIIAKILDPNFQLTLPRNISPLTRDILLGCLARPVEERWDTKRLTLALSGSFADYSLTRPLERQEKNTVLPVKGILGAVVLCAALALGAFFLTTFWEKPAGQQNTNSIAAKPASTLTATPSLTPEVQNSSQEEEKDKEKEKDEKAKHLNKQDVMLANMTVPMYIQAAVNYLGQPEEIEQGTYGDIYHFSGIDLTVVNEKGMVGAIIVKRPGIFTARGIQVGDSADQVLAAYGETDSFSYQNLDLYEYFLKKKPTVILRFAVDKASQKVNYIGVRYQ